VTEEVECQNPTGVGAGGTASGRVELGRPCTGGTLNGGPPALAIGLVVGIGAADADARRDPGGTSETRRPPVEADPASQHLHSEVFVMSARHAVPNVRGQYN